MAQMATLRDGVRAPLMTLQLRPMRVMAVPVVAMRVVTMPVVATVPVVAAVMPVAPPVPVPVPVAAVVPVAAIVPAGLLHRGGGRGGLGGGRDRKGRGARGRARQTADQRGEEDQEGPGSHRYSPV